MKILLLAGGDSSERSVSLETGAAVYESLKRQGHIVLAIDSASGKSLLTNDGKFVDFKTDDSTKNPSTNKAKAWPIATAVGSPAFQDMECVFIALHGGSGEDGMLQCLLEIAGKQHTGSSMEASAIAMDKAVSKKLCVAENIDTPDFVLYRIRNKKIDERLVEEIINRFDFPVIVKPNSGGSTIGLSKVNDESGLQAALEKSLAESSAILVEQYIKGREITAAVLNDRPLPLVEIRPKNEIYDFEAKYNKGKSDYLVPAPIDETITKEIQKAAAKIYNVIGCAGLARVDFILTEDGKFYFLELNSLPGMTELSLAPMAAAQDGMDFDQLVAEIIKSAWHE